MDELCTSLLPCLTDSARETENGIRVSVWTPFRQFDEGLSYTSQRMISASFVVQGRLPENQTDSFPSIKLLAPLEPVLTQPSSLYDLTIYLKTSQTITMPGDRLNNGEWLLAGNSLWSETAL
jgi:hypothetical protein